MAIIVKIFQFKNSSFHCHLIPEIWHQYCRNCSFSVYESFSKNVSKRYDITKKFQSIAPANAIQTNKILIEGEDAVVKVVVVVVGRGGEEEAVA